MEEKQTWFWKKEADGCANLLRWLRDSGEGKAYDEAGLLCRFPGSEESEAGGDGGFLCCFLRSGDWFWRKEADICAALLGS